MSKTQFYLIPTIAIILLGIVSCNKQEDTMAIITVRNDANNIVENAQVILSAPTTNGEMTTINDTIYTDSQGEAHFNYNHLYKDGQYGVAVLDVKAYKDSLDGYGIIEIKRETTNRATVFL